VNAPAYISIDSRVDLKAAERERIAADTHDFLRRGGEIVVVDPSVFADPTLPACATMRYRSFASKAQEEGLNRMHQAQHRRTKKNNSDIFGRE